MGINAQHLKRQLKESSLEMKTNVHGRSDIDEGKPKSKQSSH